MFPEKLKHPETQGCDCSTPKAILSQDPKPTLTETTPLMDCENEKVNTPSAFRSSDQTGQVTGEIIPEDTPKSRPKGPQEIHSEANTRDPLLLFSEY